jgi:hypothetical protein
MKNIKKLLGTMALVAMSSVSQAQFTTNLFPNGDFINGGPTLDWVEVSGGGTFGYGYPDSGGNPGNYGVITNVSGGWAIWVGGDATPLPLESLGLVPGQTYTFLQDMITLAGTNTGGVKIESWGPGGQIFPNSGDMRPATWTTNGWATYAFTYTIQPGATGIKVVPLWGVNSTVGYDNFRVRVPLTLPFTAQITSPTNGATVFSNFIITATASLLPGAVTNVEFYRGNTLLGSDDTLPYNIYVTDSALGAAALTVVARADTGASATSSVVNVTVSATPIVNSFNVNPSAAWVGFMNVFQTPQNFNGFVFGQPWGVADLSAAFSGSGASSVLTLKPAPLNDTNPFWYDYSVEPLLSNPTSMPGAVGFKEMEANMYVEVPAGAVNGNLVTFSGNCVTNTLDITLNPTNVNGIGNGWTNYAFVKELAGDTIVNASYVTLSNGLPFSVNLQTTPDPTMKVQYGFVTRGPNVWPTDVNNYGVVQVASAAAPSTNVIVDSAANWLGYMNVFANPQGGGGYIFGSPWGTADLKAAFDSSGLVLSPNTIGDVSPEWYSPSGQPGAVGIRTMEANFYQEFTGPLAGRTVTFSGTVLANTLVSASNTNALGNGWTAVAFVKDFAPDYSSFNLATVPLTPGAFSVSLFTENNPARHVQFGFQVVGPNVWATDVAPFGNIVIGNAGIAPTTIIPSRNGANINLTFASQVGKTYTVQYKNALTDGTWFTLTTTNGTGANAVVTDPTSGSQRFYRLSIQ